MPNAAAIKAGNAYFKLGITANNLNRFIQDDFNKIFKLSKEIASVSHDAFSSFRNSSKYITSAIEVFSSFDDQMRVVKVVSGATGDAFDDLTSRAKELGRTTAFTASQIAEGMAELGRVGYSPDEINKAIAAVAALSSATTTDLATATIIAGKTLRTFGMDASEMGRVCDVLTATANGSAQTIDDLGAAMKYVAPIAAKSGMTLEETAKVLGTLANFGIKGSDVGTTFENMSVKLNDEYVQEKYKSIGVDVVDQDTGALRNMSDVLKEISVAVANLPTADRLEIFQELFGTDGFSVSGESILSTAESFDKLYASIDNAFGAAEASQQTLEGGLGGSIRAAKSAVEGLAISLGNALAPTVQELVDILKKCAAIVDALIGPFQKSINTVAKCGLVFAGVNGVIFVAAKSFSILTSQISMFANVARLGGAALGALTGVTNALTAATATKIAMNKADESLLIATTAMVNARTAAERLLAMANFNVAFATAQKATNDYAAAAAALAHKVQVVALGAACAVALAAVAALAGSMIYFTMTAEKGVQKAKEFTKATEQRAQTNEQAQQKDAELFAELENLASQGDLTNEEFARGRNIIDQLTSKYGDLGLSVDNVAKKFNIAADAKSKLDEAMAKARKADLQAQITALENENKQIDRSISQHTGSGFKSMVTNYGKLIGSTFGMTDSVEESVKRLNGDKEVNFQKLTALRAELQGVNDADEARKKDKENRAKGINVVDTREAKKTSSEFEDKIKTDSNGKYEAQRDEIQKQYGAYLEAQKKIRDAVYNDSTKTYLERAQADDVYNANITKAREWKDLQINPIDAEETRENAEADRNASLAAAQSRLYEAQTAYRGDATDANKKALEEAAAALKGVEKENAEDRAQDAFDRLNQAAQALKEARTTGNAAQVEAAQKELADAQQEAANASNALGDSMTDSVQESVGTFDAFEAFDMTNDWEREAMEKQTEALEEVAVVAKDIKKAIEDGRRDENGVVYE